MLSYLLAQLWSQPAEQYNRPDELWINEALPLYLGEIVNTSSEINEFYYKKRRIALANEIEYHELKELKEPSSKFVMKKLKDYDTRAVKGAY